MRQKNEKGRNPRCRIKSKPGKNKNKEITNGRNAELPQTDQEALRRGGTYDTARRPRGQGGGYRLGKIQPEVALGCELGARFASRLGRSTWGNQR